MLPRVPQDPRQAPRSAPRGRHQRGPARNRHSQAGGPDAAKSPTARLISRDTPPRDPGPFRDAAAPANGSDPHAARPSTRVPKPPGSMVGPDAATRPSPDEQMHPLTAYSRPASTTCRLGVLTSCLPRLGDHRSWCIGMRSDSFPPFEPHSRIPSADARRVASARVRQSWIGKRDPRRRAPCRRSRLSAGPRSSFSAGSLHRETRSRRPPCPRHSRQVQGHPDRG